MAAAKVLVGEAADSAHTPCGDQGLRNQGAACVSHVHAQAGHEGVNLLGYL